VKDVNNNMGTRDELTRRGVRVISAINFHSVAGLDVPDVNFRSHSSLFGES
jgi:hypothetical protein